MFLPEPPGAREEPATAVLCQGHVAAGAPAGVLGFSEDPALHQVLTRVSHALLFGSSRNCREI